MVKGLNVFKQYFTKYPNQYVIVGGTACDEHISDAGLNYRVTKDIDLILVVEALNKEFVEVFWKFIGDGAYKQKEKSADEREYYRFLNPENADFPAMVEIFSRKPDEVKLTEPAHLTPIPTDQDLSSLSAILMDNDYYHYLLQNSSDLNGLKIADISALICLKAKAFLEINERIEKGLEQNKKKVDKHKKDVFRLALMLTEETQITLPKALQQDLKSFLQKIQLELPGKALFKDIGVPSVKAEELYALLNKCFQIAQQ